MIRALLVALCLDVGLPINWGQRGPIKWRHDEYIVSGCTYRIDLLEPCRVTLAVDGAPPANHDARRPEAIHIPVPIAPAGTPVEIRLVSGRRSSTLYTVVVD